MPTAVPDATPPAATQGLVARARARLALGDVAGARLYLERAVELGDGSAALMLGSSYDTAWLAAQGVQGVTADPERARTYFERARELGAAEAVARLRALDAATR
jgi:TPR repeat protein